MPWGSLAGYRSPSLRQETTEERKRESGTGEMNDIFLMENVCHRKKKRRCAGEGERDRERDKRRTDWKHPQTREATKLNSITRRDEDGGDRCVQ